MGGDDLEGDYLGEDCLAGDFLARDCLTRYCLWRHCLGEDCLWGDCLWEIVLGRFLAIPSTAVTSKLQTHSRIFPRTSYKTITRDVKKITPTSSGTSATIR